MNAMETFKRKSDLILKLTEDLNNNIQTAEYLKEHSWSEGKISISQINTTRQSSTSIKRQILAIRQMLLELSKMIY